MVTEWKGLHISAQREVEYKKCNDMQRVIRTRCMRKDSDDEEGIHNYFSNM